MRPARPFALAAPALLGLLLALSACAHPTKPFTFDALPEVPAERKVPLRVGLYMHPRFDAIKKEGLKDWGKLGGEVIEAALGGTKGLVEKVFAETVALESPEAARSRGDLEAVVIPELEYIRFWKGTMSVSVSMRWTVMDPAGKIFYQNTFIGKSHSPSGLDTFSSEALEDQFRQAFQGLTATPWWKAAKAGAN